VLSSRLARDDINIGRQIKRFHHITGTFDSVVLRTLCFITLPRLLAAALASPRLPRRARRHDSVNSPAAALAVLEGIRSCRLACRHCLRGESAFIYLIVLHYPPKLTWVPSGPLVLCDLFNAREPARRSTAAVQFVATCSTQVSQEVCSSCSSLTTLPPSRSF
jgi:hypothetical protein